VAGFGLYVFLGAIALLAQFAPWVLGVLFAIIAMVGVVTIIRDVSNWSDRRSHLRAVRRQRENDLIIIPDPSSRDDSLNG
jgi:membrane protein implicated in regulation of membrane protease activity